MKIDTQKLSASSASFLSMMGNDNAGITQIDICDLTPYPNQPFQVHEDSAMQELADDIQANGILFPIIVRPLDDKYQILAGHRRTKAAQLAGLTQVPCRIKDVDDNTAMLIVTNTNLTQRQKLLPSERAFAYLMQKQAYENMSVHSVRTTSQIAEDSQESVRNIQYYLKIAQLVPSLLNLIDREQLPVKLGAALTSLSPEAQQILGVFLTEHDLNLTAKQADLLCSIKTIDNAVLESIFFSHKKNSTSEELLHDTYTIDRTTLSDTLQRAMQLQCGINPRDGIVLKQKQYAKVLKAQQIINQQLDIIQSLCKKK